MTNLLWPDWLDEVWAKSPEKDGEPGESLARHTWQVAQRLSEMIRLRPYLPELVGFPGLWHTIFWACILHDFGKVARGFQEWLRGGPWWPHRHEVLSLAFLEWFGGAFSQEENLWTTAAIIFHHKDSREISLLYMGVENCSEDAVEHLIAGVEAGVLEGIWRWLAECLPTWIETLKLSCAEVRMPELIPLEKALTQFQSNGALNIRKRLRNLRRWEREVTRFRKEALIVGTLALRGHIVSCDHAASAHTGILSQLHLQRPDELLTRWSLSKNDLYSHQASCLQTKGSAVLIAPTGSGKTEAALLWACSQAYGEKMLSRLFYTLPYQASMNAMYDRLRQKSFPGQVGLEHNRNTLALYRRFLEENYNRKQAIQLAKLTKNLSRLHYFPIRVLSPYQMLKGPYRLKGYEALLTDFLGAAFIFDEMHAYEVERMAEILATIKYLRENFGASFFVMSATLPGLLQSRLAGILGSNTTIRATPEVFTMFKRHRLLVQEGDLLQGAWLERIVKDAKNDRSILVCCNTVKRAQQAYDELAQRLNGHAELVLLHGRFNGRDRLNKEMLVQVASGSTSNARRPIILVSTQVVEVSLDIDLDVIYTDPAPLEALIQRFGRINRRRLKKWAPVNVFTEPAGGQYIYEDELVQKSLEVLKKNTNKVINEEEISGWLDEIYQGDIAERWNKAFQEAYENFEAACLRTLRPFDANESLEELFFQAFDSIEVLPACLENKYRAFIVADEPLEARQLFVPLSWGQYCKLRRKGAVRDSEDGWPKIVEVPYNSEVGLQVT